MVETRHEKKKAHAGLDIASSSRPLKGWKNFNFEAKAFQRNREFLPNFMVTMRPSYVKERCMAIPAAFAKKYFKMNEAPVSLKVLGGESTWEVKYKCWTANNNSKRNKYKFQDGWNRFVLGNQLKVGDVCDFVFTNSKPIRFTVVIYRAAENPSCPRLKAQTADPQVACKRSNEEVVDSDNEESNEEPQPKKKKTSRSKATPSVKPPKPQLKAKQTTKVAVKRKDDATPYKASSKRTKHSGSTTSDPSTKHKYSWSDVYGEGPTSRISAGTVPRFLRSKAQKSATPASVSKQTSSDPDSVSSDSKHQETENPAPVVISKDPIKKGTKETEAHSDDVHPNDSAHKTSRENEETSKQEEEKVDKPDDQLQVIQRIEIPAASYDTKVLLEENLPHAHLPFPSTDTMPTVIKPEKVSAPKLEDLIDFLSEAGRRSSSRFVHSSNLQGQVSTDSQVAKLMQNLKSLSKHPLNTLCTDSRIRSKMAKLLMELEPIRNNLPASSRGTLASIQDFFNRLSKKVSTINEVVPSFEAEELNRDNLLNTLRSMKTTMDKETRLISAGTQAKLETDKKIVELEAELKEAKLRSLQFEQALSVSKEKVRRIDEDSKELGTTARSIVKKLQTMEPEYLAAKADKESLEKTWEEIRNSESWFS